MQLSYIDFITQCKYNECCFVVHILYSPVRFISRTLDTWVIACISNYWLCRIKSFVSGFYPIIARHGASGRGLIRGKSSKLSFDWELSVRHTGELASQAHNSDLDGILLYTNCFQIVTIRSFKSFKVRILGWDMESGLRLAKRNENNFNHQSQFY